MTPCLFFLPKLSISDDHCVGTLAPTVQFSETYRFSDGWVGAVSTMHRLIAASSEQGLDATSHNSCPDSRDKFAGV